MKPFLKWAGGKQRLIPQFEPYLPNQIDHYVEPFLGGGALFFHLANRCNRATLADTNWNLINAYRAVKSKPEALLELLDAMSERYCKAHYYKVRDEYNGFLRDSFARSVIQLDQAARFIYLNKTGYNGLYRENSRGAFNVPWGQYKKPRICDPIIREASGLLQNAELIWCPYSIALARPLGLTDLVYLDPPYIPISPTSNFTSYQAGGFDLTQQHHLAVLAGQIKQRGIPILVSNSSEALLLYSSQFKPIQILAARSVNSKGDGRAPILEYLFV